MTSPRSTRTTLVAVLLVVAGVAAVAIFGPPALRVVDGSDADAMPRGPFFLRSGAYQARTTEVSDIRGGEQGAGAGLGRLLKVSRERGGASFLIAYDEHTKPDSLPLREGWTIEELGRDAMWLPAACAQMPSWIVGDRYLLINEARYDGFEVVDNYVVYDLVRRTFTYLTDPDARAGKAATKVLAVRIESGNAVFYLDARDRKGPHHVDREYRHSLAHHNGFVVRRVISLRDLSFADYKIPFSTPPIDDYVVQIFGQWPALFLGVADRSDVTSALAPLKPGRKLALRPGQYVPPADPPADAAMQAARAAVAPQRHREATTVATSTPASAVPSGVHAEVVARTPDTIYLRAFSTAPASSVPVEFDVRRSNAVVPLGADLASGGFVIGAFSRPRG